MSIPISTSTNRESRFAASAYPGVGIDAAHAREREVEQLHAKRSGN